MDLFEKLKAKRKKLSNQLSDPAAVGFWRMVVDKYSEKAHFLYELFQNADDTKATYIRMVLTKAGLYFIHNGSVQFTLTDPDEEGKGKPIGHLNSITSVGASTKIQSSSIGKFGIGFKSVFQYTKQPHIEDDAFCFSLNDYIVPELEERIPNMRMNGETLFYFPFVNPEVAIFEINKTISNMDCPLLFMNNLKEISWKSEIDGADLKWQSKVLSSDTFVGKDGLGLRHQFINCKTPLKETFYHFLWTDVEHKEKGHLSAAVVYGSTADGCIVPLERGKNTYCYFLLEESSDLPFIIHAPFLLTENRELIKKDDEWNAYLYTILAKVSASLFLIVADGKLKLGSDAVFDYLPDVANEKDGNSTPFIKEFVETVRANRVLKSNDGTFVSSAETIYSQDAMLPKVFTNEMLSTLNSEWSTKKWAYAFLSSSQNADKKTCLEFLLKHKLVGFSCEIEDVIPFINTDFLSKQSDEWLLQFYTLISKHKSLLASSLFKTSPLIKCADGVFRSLDNEYGICQLYLNTEQNNTNNFSLLFVDALFNKPALSEFCEITGIGEPSEFAFIEKGIIANYNNSSVSRDNIQQIVSDLTRIAIYFSSLAFDVEAKKDLIALVSDVTFLPTIDNKGNVSFSEPDLVYFDTKDLRDYFGSKDDVLYFDSSIILKSDAMMREKLYYFLQSIGVAFYPRIVEDGIIPRGNDLEYFDIQPKSLRVHDNGAQHVVDKYIDGFDNFMSNWTPKSSIAFYRLLGKMVGESGAFALRKQMNGLYSYYEKSKQKQTEETIYKTTANKQMFEKEWLTSFDGKQVGLSAIQNATDLFEDCMVKDSDLSALQFLGIQFDNSLANLSPEHKKVITLFKRLKDAGVSEEDLHALLEGKAKIKYE